MPQSRNNTNSSTKKKKGRAPAHQNTFAFQHNPKSKLTEKITASPIQHVCQRCYDKLEWRKNYRKYKPRTQPGTCNICHRRNVKHAYHTICTACTTSDKAYKILDELRNVIKEESNDDNEIKPRRRVCAMCVKDEALPEKEDKDSIEETMSKLGRISLRQRRTIERTLLKEQEQQGKNGNKNNNDSDEEEEEENHNDDYEEEEPVSDNDSVLGDEFHLSSDDDDDDEFLKAIGGAEMMMTGEAYQEKLLTGDDTSS